MAAAVRGERRGGPKTARAWRRSCQFTVWLVFGASLSLGSGCARTVTFKMDDRINTDMHVARRTAERTGEPLQVDIVCVYPQDLEKEVNRGLKPDSELSCRDWYSRRPSEKSSDPSGRFDLPSAQIYYLADRKDLYGTRRGPGLRGAIEETVSERTVSGIRFHAPGWANFSGSVHDANSVIYVIPKFIDREGNVMAIPPLKYHPPGGKDHLHLRIGVDNPEGSSPKQYVKKIIVEP